MQLPNHKPGKLDTLSQHALQNMHFIKEAARAQNIGQADPATKGEPELCTLTRTSNSIPLQYKVGLQLRTASKTDKSPDFEILDHCSPDERSTTDNVQTPATVDIQKEMLLVSQFLTQNRDPGPPIFKDPPWWHMYSNTQTQPWYYYWINSRNNDFLYSCYFTETYSCDNIDMDKY